MTLSRPPEGQRIHFLATDGGRSEVEFMGACLYARISVDDRYIRTETGPVIGKGGLCGHTMDERDLTTVRAHRC